MNSPTFSSLLVRLPAGASAGLGATTPTLNAAGVDFELEVLFATGAPPAAALGVAAPAGPAWVWHIARPKGSTAGANPWELSHALSAAGMGIVSGDAFVEPDLLQDWNFQDPGARAGGLAATGKCVFVDQNAVLPGVKGKFAWHLDDAFSGLRKARTTVGAPAGNVIRIAHLDTGYDPAHQTLPAHLRQDLERNFLPGENLHDASDPAVGGFLKNPGHGTATLGILAGNKFTFAAPGYTAFADFLGGAPHAEVVPIRVGTSVVQLLTSAVAAGINYAAELCRDPATRIHVMSMSMGGLASQAWADAVNKAYESGIVYVAAAGNNFSAGLFGVPTRMIVFPARFRRVLAACGVMANAHPYFGLPIGSMQGNWGPESKMATALSAFTPNMPWATRGCPGIVEMDGAGTSAATPQIAAAAALYFQKHAAVLLDAGRYREPWMRVEAVRNALFNSANKSADGGSSSKLGNGILQAAAALGVAPAAAALLRKTPADDASFAFLRAFTGFGLAPTDSKTRMFALEATQLAQRSFEPGKPNPLESLVSDPDLPADAISPAQRQSFFEQLLNHPQASRPLRAYAENALSSNSAASAKPKSALPAPAPSPAEPPTPPVASALSLAPTVTPPLASVPPRAAFIAPTPPYRKLRGFAIDPSLATDLETAPISRATFKVRWERLDPGPVGEYLEVIDHDPASGCYYEPVALDDPTLLAQDGLAPSEGTPQFHQQMVYAVASLTIQNFERALGRRSLWRPGKPPVGADPKNDSTFVRRLRLHPHALRERNAYYTPQKVALLFGYFKAAGDDPGNHMPGSMVFACLSHDIIAHETTHALLDGMNRAFLRPTNLDVHAFHEGFADLVALLQHFTFPEILHHQIAATRGDIGSQNNLLGQLAGEFGRGIGLRGALRNAIGRIVAGKWEPHVPRPDEFESTTEPHLRGAILVAAVFDAFIAIYERRTADLLRLATGGTGVLRPGAIHPDLVDRLAQEAAKSAQHVLNMCVRAIDYCPPVDITFGEYLRALITADFDLVEDDDLGYRVAFIQAFRRRGIYPHDVRTLSVESLRWRSSINDEMRPSVELEDILSRLREFAERQGYLHSREDLFNTERGMRQTIHGWLVEHFAAGDEAQRDAVYLGLKPGERFEVRAARIAQRVGPDGQMIPQLLLSLLQETSIPVNPDDPNGPQMPFEGGSVVIADLRARRIKYCIRKNLTSASRQDRQRGFAVAASASLRATYLGAGPFDNHDEPFAALHRGY